MHSSEHCKAVEHGLVKMNHFGAPPAPERRPKRRKRALLPGVGVYASGNNKFDCTIRDISEDGARIAIPRNTPYPSHFFLINVRDRVAHAAKVVWGDNTEMGVSFASTIPLAESTNPDFAFLRRHWLERAVR